MEEIKTDIALIKQKVEATEEKLDQIAKTLLDPKNGVVGKQIRTEEKLRLLYWLVGPILLGVVGIAGRLFAAW